MSVPERDLDAEFLASDFEAILKASGTPYTIDDTAEKAVTLRWTPQAPTPPTA